MSFEPPDDELDFSDLADAVAAVEEQPGSSDQLVPGAHIGSGRFELVEYIDRGAMGEIWQVRDTLFDREMAVKVVRVRDRVNPAERDEITARVIREALAAHAASECCVHIVRIFDVAALPTGDPFIVMEYLAGSNLRAWLLDNMPADWRVVRSIATQCAKALAALHENGFVHRDIKPDNIFALNRRTKGDVDAPFIKLIDFGLAKDLEAGRLTKTAMSIGTQRYMAPEQFNSQRATPRSDVFSLGIVLYEALTGINPLPIGRAELITAYQEGLDPLELHDVDAPDWLVALVNRCLSIEPTRRPDAEELLEQLTSPPTHLPNLPELPAIDTQIDSIPALEDPLTLPSLEAEILTDEPVSLEHGAPAPSPTPLPQDTIAAPSLPELPAEPQPPVAALPAHSTKLAFFDERPTSATDGAPRRSMAIALFAGLALIALAIVYTSEPATQSAAPAMQIASQPEVTFKPRGPVKLDDFPAGHAPPTDPPKPRAPNSAPERTTPSDAPAPSSTTPASSAKIAESPRPGRRRPKRPGTRKRSGMTKSFAKLRDEVASRAGQAPMSNAPAQPRAGAVAALEFDDDAGPNFGADLIKPKASAKLPVGYRFNVMLTTGISSSRHTTVVAKLREDVVIDGQLVLAKGDVVRGRSSNDTERVFIDFKEAIHAGSALKFKGHAVTDGLPGLKAHKKAIPKDERSTNVLARAGLRTVEGIGGPPGVAGRFAGEVADEGAREVRGDFQSRQSFVLTVQNGARFTVIVTGK